MRDLLEPTLSQDTPHEPIFSQRALFFLAFFGGPIALTLMAAQNAVKLKRLRRDLPFFLGAAILHIVLLGGIVWAVPEGADILKWIATQRRENLLFRYGTRIYALALWGGFMLLHRPFYKAASLMGDAPANPWRTALSCFGLALIIDLALLAGLYAVRM